MTYSLTFTKQALRDMEHLNEPFYSAIKNAIFNLTLDPRPNGYIKLKGRDGFRIRVGSYRIIYDIFDSVLNIEVIAIGHRKDIYD